MRHGRAWRLPTPLVYLRTMAVFLVVWALVARWTANAVLLPSPLVVIEAFVDLARELELFVHAGISFGRLLLSVGIASLVAIPRGLLMGLSRTLAARGRGAPARSRARRPPRRR